MDVELALKINKLVHNECKDVPHDIGLRIEELVRLHQSELKNCSIPAVMGELTCDNCGCHPNVIYTTGKGRFCEQCKPSS